jgi:hypothetical protein
MFSPMQTVADVSIRTVDLPEGARYVVRVVGEIRGRRVVDSVGYLARPADAVRVARDIRAHGYRFPSAR